MKINKVIDNTVAAIEIEGRLDTMTAPDLEKSVMGDLTGIKSLTFDLKNLEYVSSAGLRVLLSIQKIMNRQGTMVIKNANDTVMDIFEVTGFVDILDIQ